MRNVPDITRTRHTIPMTDGHPIMRLFPALLAASMLVPAPAAAQAVDLGEVQRQIAAMQAEIARLTAQVSELSAQVEAQEAVPVPALAAPPAAQPVAAPAAND